MNWWLRFRRRRSLEQDLADELSFHKHMRSADAGAPPFGNETLVRDGLRELWTFRWIEAAIADLVFAVRGWRKNPAFAITMIGSLALGIRAVIAIFTAADDLLFRPLPYGDPGRLVFLKEASVVAESSGRNTVSPDNFLDWKTRNSVFEDMAYVDEGRSVFSDESRSEELHVQRVPLNFFDVLGVTPWRGHLASEVRPIRNSESQGLQSQVVISYRLWQSWFAGDPGVIGRRVQLDSFPRTVGAVMPPEFSFGDREVDVWPYMMIYPSGPHERGARSMQAVARLKPGIRFGQAQAQMTAIARQLEQTDPQFNKNWTVTLVNLRDAFSRSVKTSLLVLLGAVSLLLAVACANAANLLLGRYSSRRAEMAMRVALGAGRWRLTRQLLTESLLIALCAGVAGLALGRSMLAGLVAVAPPALTQTVDIFIDWRIALFAIGISVVTGLLFGLAPSIIGAKASLAGRVRSSIETTSRRSLRGWLIAGEIAVSVVLLTGGCLLFRSLVRLQQVHPGLNSRNVLTFHFRVMSPQDVIRFAQAIDGIGKMPGVRAASATSFLPFDGPAAVTAVKISGHPARRLGEEPGAVVRTVMPRYFETMGIPILAGRDFSDTDNIPQAPLRFLVNQVFVRTYLEGENPLAQNIAVRMARSNPPGQIVGVVGDVKEGSLSNPPVPTVYYVYSHMPYGQMTLVLRTAQDPLTLAAPVRQVMRNLDPELAVADVRTMQNILNVTYARERFLATLMGGFSACAMLLAAVGIYGILAYSVSSRTPEIGIRQALGATGSQIVKMVLADGAWFVIAGIATGTAAAYALTRLLASLLYRTSVSDPWAFGLALGILLIVALAAAYIPARRASRLEPIQALRAE